MFGFKKWLSRFLILVAAASPPEQVHELAVGVMPIRQLSLDGNGYYRFVITDGWGLPSSGKRGGRGHLGLDFMRRRDNSGRPDLPEFTKHFYCPSDAVSAVACVPGEVAKVRKDGNGEAVYVLHGRYMSVYRHLKNVAVRGGEAVDMGAHLGYVSHAPKNPRGINHLHFELWDTNRRNGGRWNRAKQAIDPTPFVKKWARA